MYHTVGRAEVGEQTHDLIQRLGVRAQVVPEHAARQSESQVSPPSTLVVLFVLEMRLRVALLGLQQTHERPGPA